MYKLICIDLDGTLLDSHQRVSTTNKQAIKKALDLGIEVAIVSGRPNCFTTRIMNQIDERMGHVTFNGAYYRVAGKSNRFPIDKEIIKEIARLGRLYNVRIFFKNKNLGLCTKSDPGILDYDKYKEQTAPKDRIDFHFYVDAPTYFDNNDTEILKVFSWDNNVEGLKKLGAEVSKLPNINFYRYDDYFECSSNQTSKGKAILKVADELGIKVEEIASIGDNFNDVPMFEIAGLSIAMENGPIAVKEMCDVVTLNNDENGVAYAIENYILKEVDQDEV